MEKIFEESDETTVDDDSEDLLDDGFYSMEEMEEQEDEGYFSMEE